MSSATTRWSSWLLLSVLLAALAVHAGGVCLDFAAAIRSPLELDYGEGIVWQQSLLIPGPRMYSASPALPFVVFHYPPLFYLAVRAMRLLQPDVLAAGRLVSTLSTTLIALLVTALVLVASRRPGKLYRASEIAIAVASGMLVLSLHGLRSWGMLMRVDMIAIACGMAGLLVAAWATARFWGTTLALLLCVAGLFGKQTELPPGIAVFLVTLVRAPAVALGAAAISGGVALLAVAGLQWSTGGGFLQNIIGYNINRFSPGGMFWALWPERPSLPVIALIAVAFVSAMCRLLPSLAAWRLRLVGQDLGRLRFAGRATACRAMLVTHLVCSSAMLCTAMKSGSSYNYLLDWLCVGCVLLGVLLADLWRNPTARTPASRTPASRTPVWQAWRFDIVAVLLLAAVFAWPIRAMPDQVDLAALAAERALVQRIAAAAKPVGSENMTLLMQAGKPVIYEPSIVTELASVGRWDEAPLVALIRAHGLAFMLTTDDHTGGSLRRSPAVDAAMRAVFPHTDQVGPALWLHEPAD